MAFEREGRHRREPAWKQTAVGVTIGLVVGGSSVALLYETVHGEELADKRVLEVETPTVTYEAPFDMGRPSRELAVGEKVVAQCYAMSATIGVDFIAISTGDVKDIVTYAPVSFRNSQEKPANNFDRSPEELQSILPACKLVYEQYNPTTTPV